MQNVCSLKELPDVNGVPVLVRLDFNVPILNGSVAEDYRIKKSLPTIEALQAKGAKIVILSHIEGTSDTLAPVFEYLKSSLSISFCKDILAEGPAKIAAMKPGDVLLAENIRQYPGEKKNDPAFAAQLAALGKLYVDDAFSVAHREHASVVGVPKLLPSFIGIQFQKEVDALSLNFSPKHPFLFILAGAKFDTKLPLVEKFLKIADTIFIGGALSNDLYKAKGFAVGKSLVSNMAGASLAELANNSHIVAPVDTTVQSEKGKRVVAPNGIAADEAVMDVGPETLSQLRDLLISAKHILWNGTLGAYEKGFIEPTKALGTMVAEATARGVTTIIGGGDTLAAIGDVPESSFTFVSTGGGAMLDFLAKGTVPGLEALKS